MPEHRKLICHNRKQRTLATIIHDVEGQTTKLHDAVEAAQHPAPPPIDNKQVLIELRATVADMQKVIDDVNAVIAELDAKSAAPTPAPKPTPVPPANPPGPSSTITWPSFTGTDAFVGRSLSGNVTVYVDASLGAEAMQNAHDLVADADRIFSENSMIFGLRQTAPVRGAPVNVLLFAIDGETDGSGGADHLGCTFVSGGNIEVCVSYGASMRCSGLFEAELSECAMQGQLCGLSTGEALSRWCAAVISGDALADFATAPAWALAGYANWVDRVDQTDQNADSIGCGMVFISYLLHRGATLPQIAQAMVRLGNDGTFAELYAALRMGQSHFAWPTFADAVRTIADPVTSDDPFGQVTMAMSPHKHV